MDLPNLKESVDIAQIVTTFLVFIGLIAAIFQLRAARETMRQQALVKLSDDWRDVTLYKAITYIHNLRYQWEASNFQKDKWCILAEQWVEKHKAVTRGQNPEGRLWEEWMYRRTASQFLSKMGYMASIGYLKYEDLFGIVPEMGRLLAVLIPLELAIQAHMKARVKDCIASWDEPVSKWEFNGLWQNYLRWEGKRKVWFREDKYELKPIEWTEVPQPRRK